MAKVFTVEALWDAEARAFTTQSVVDALASYKIEIVTRRELVFA